MDKLSSILPTSPRVQNVDLSDSPPVRPGTPTFGRAVGANTIKDRMSLSQEAKDIAFKDTLAGMNPKEAKSAKIADDVSKKFFETKASVDAIKSRPASEETMERTVELEENLPQQVQVKVPSQAAVGSRPGERLNLEA